MNGKPVLPLALAASTLLALTAHAVPRSGEGSGPHFLVAAESLTAWHAGAYLRNHDRMLKKDGFEREVEMSRIMGYVGRDVLSWLSVYGTVGMASVDDDVENLSQDAAEFGVGTWFNLLDHDTFEFLETVQRFRVQGMLQYTLFDTDNVTWGELAGNITFGITHEIIGSKFFWPDAVTLYVGPTVNLVNSDEYDHSSDDMFGFVIGLDLQINRATSLGASMEIYQDDDASVGYVSVRF